MKLNKKKIRGSVLLETIMATMLFVFFAGVILVSLIYARENQYNSYLYNRANQLTQEGMEAVFSMKGVRASP